VSGVYVAFFVLTSWLFALGLALTQVQLNNPSDVLNFLWLIVIIQFLYIGLFITVHDACHGSVAPGHPKFNLWVGRTFAFFYAGFNFDRLAKKHHAHHIHSGTDLDPDFHAPGKDHFFFWLLRFLGQYVTLRQILTMCLVAQILMHGLKVPEINVFAFWVAPSVLSSLQLFYFGTYLPHRKMSTQAFNDHHHTRNISIPYLLSLISCYHFGAFHHNHHRKPQRPWFHLPQKIEIIKASQVKQRVL
jgi:beta-carotene ketolase (CrtW type)